MGWWGIDGVYFKKDFGGDWVSDECVGLREKEKLKMILKFLVWVSEGMVKLWKGIREEGWGVFLCVGW